MSKGLYLGIDQGTTGTTAILLDERWRMVGRGYREITQHYPRAGWVEHDPEEIWTSVLVAVEQALTNADANASDIRGLGLDHEGESVVVWEAKTGRPVYPAVVWQDRRTAAYADHLRKQYSDLVRKKTGLMIDSYFSATKLKWIFDHVDADRQRSRCGELLAGTMDVWLLWRMTGGKTFYTDASTASRTMLYNLHTGDWDPELLQMLGICRDVLPEIGDSAGIVGMTVPESFLGISCPISGIIVDQQAALLGQACTETGAVKTTYGTGCFMLMNTGGTPMHATNGISTTVAWQINGTRSYALDGSVYIAGAAIQWLRDGLKIIDAAAQTEHMASQVKSSGGVFFVPAFSGMATPHWDSYARGTMLGITGGTTQDHIVRATLESIAYQVKDVLDVMRRDSGVCIQTMRCDGGVTQNSFLMQFQADILNIPLEIPEIPDATALGAAYMAAIGRGELSSLQEAASLWRLKRRYEPEMTEERRQALLFDWHRAVERSLDWAHH